MYSTRLLNCVTFRLEAILAALHVTVGRHADHRAELAYKVRLIIKAQFNRQISRGLLPLEQQSRRFNTQQPGILFW
jgi:hypothetical protein